MRYTEIRKIYKKYHKCKYFIFILNSKEVIPMC